MTIQLISNHFRWLTLRVFRNDAELAVASLPDLNIQRSHGAHHVGPERVGRRIFDDWELVWHPRLAVLPLRRQVRHRRQLDVDGYRLVLDVEG